jgi:hypothetical protein
MHEKGDKAPYPVTNEREIVLYIDGIKHTIEDVSASLVAGGDIQRIDIEVYKKPHNTGDRYTTAKGIPINKETVTIIAQERWYCQTDILSEDITPSSNIPDDPKEKTYWKTDPITPTEQNPTVWHYDKT